jgi:hypothetical protein
VALFGAFLGFQALSLRPAETPLVAQQWSAAASTMALLGILVAIIGVVHGFWVGVILVVVNYVAMSVIAKKLDPRGL